MKRIAALAFSAVLMLAGCEQANGVKKTPLPEKKSQLSIDVTEPQTALHVIKHVSEINIHEVGGEDGRDYEWSVSRTDGKNVFSFNGDRINQSAVYNITDEEYEDIITTDFTEYIGKKDELEGQVCDWIDYDIILGHDDGSEDICEVYVPELWKKLYGIMDKYKE